MVVFIRFWKNFDKLYQCLEVNLCILECTNTMTQFMLGSNVGLSCNFLMCWCWILTILENHQFMIHVMTDSSKLDFFLEIIGILLRFLCVGLFQQLYHNLFFYILIWYIYLFIYLMQTSTEIVLQLIISYKMNFKNNKNKITWSTGLKQTIRMT
jgi:hypothetical protein